MATMTMVAATVAAACGSNGPSPQPWSQTNGGDWGHWWQLGGEWQWQQQGREWSGRGRAGASGWEQSIKVGKGGSSSAGVGATAGQEQQGKEMVASGGRWWQKGRGQAAKGWVAGGRWQKGRQQVAGGRRVDGRWQKGRLVGGRCK